MLEEGGIKTLRGRGYRLTRQRQLVLDVLENNQGHLDAETIFVLAKASKHNISLATVYRTLAILKEAGLVKEHRLGKEHGHYETASSSPHYHFTCLKCERVIEFKAPEVVALAQKLCNSEGIEILDMHLHFSGYCTNCRQLDDPKE